MAWSATTGLVARFNPAVPPTVVADHLEEGSGRIGIGWQELANTDDWQVLSDEPDVSAEVVGPLRVEHMEVRALELCIPALSDVSDELTATILLAVERAFRSGAAPDRVLNGLLVAPIGDPERPAQVMTAAYALGCAASAKMFDDLRTLQPLIRRLSEAWLGLPPSLFSGLARSREATWRLLVQRSLMKNLLQSTSEREFVRRWNELAFLDSEPAARRALNHLGLQLAQRLFPGTLRGDELVTGPEAAWEQVDATALASRTKRLAPAAKRARAIKQVEAIAAAVSEGHDQKARKFLRELISSQHGEPEKAYAVKSLCNIAQRCADLFRPDFERECLSGALAIDPLDTWTLIQWGDHLKRMGAYDDAERALRLAIELSSGEQSTVAESAFADVLTESGRFAEAERAYKAIEGWQRTVAIRTALADILRYQGLWREAKDEYGLILREWSNELRPWIGLAEVLKQTDDLDEAVAIYDRVLTTQGLGEREEVVYRLAKAGILKRQSRFDQALAIVDQAVERLPFLMEARVERGALLALIGRTHEGLMALPLADPLAPGPWIKSFAHGLILLRLGRLADARNLLLNSEVAGHVPRSAHALVALARVLLRLYENDEVGASNLLEGLGPTNDRLLDVVAELLRYHLVALARDGERAMRLQEQLSAQLQPRDLIAQAMGAIRRLNWSAARHIEAELLLTVF